MIYWEPTTVFGKFWTLLWESILLKSHVLYGEKKCDLQCSLGSCKLILNSFSDVAFLQCSNCKLTIQEDIAKNLLRQNSRKELGIWLFGSLLGYQCVVVQIHIILLEKNSLSHLFIHLVDFFFLSIANPKFSLSSHFPVSF